VDVVEQRSKHAAPAWRHWAFVGYVVFMLLLFLLPAPGSVNTPTHSDKVVHFAVFLGFAVLFRLDRTSRPAPALLASVTFAIVIEMLQALLPYRDADWSDLVAGGAGGIVGPFLVLWRTRQP
jgi:VanZ family protein